VKPALRLLIFPIAWFAGLLLIDLLFTAFSSITWMSQEVSFFSAFLVYAIAVSWGALCFAVVDFLLQDPGPKIRDNTWAVRFVGSIALVFVGPFIVSGSARAFSYDPIGVGNDVGMPPCVPTDANRLADDRGPVATVREVHCVGDWDEPSIYFVFVHKIANTPERQDLVLRYDGGWEGDRWGEPPEVAWAGNTTLKIKGGGKIEQITEQRSRVDGIDIRYSLTLPTCPPTFNSWERLLWNWFRLFVLCTWLA
jgi:hypothetical protein